MGLKFERTDDLEKLFESFAVDPDKQPLDKEKDRKTKSKGQDKKEQSEKK